VLTTLVDAQEALEIEEQKFRNDDRWKRRAAMIRFNLVIRPKRGQIQILA
jgi:hypothetical protein